MVFAGLTLECRTLKDIIEKNFKTIAKTLACPLSDRAVYEEYTPGM
jgi:putative transposase